MRDRKHRPWRTKDMTKPTHNDQIRAIFAERAAIYTTSASHTDEDALAWVVRCARPQPGWRVLDVATGTGHTAFALAPHVAHVTAVDLTPEMLDEARGLQQKNGLANVAFQTGDAHKLPFEDGRFDLVTSRRAPHHFTEIRTALAEMRRVLRPGGRLVVDDRSVPEDDEVDAIMNRLDVLHDPSHVRQYRPSEWRSLLEAAGFKVESVEPFARDRSIRQLQRGVPAADAAEIERILRTLTARQMSLMQVTERGNELHHLHYFVMIAAVNPGE